MPKSYFRYAELLQVSSGRARRVRILIEVSSLSTLTSDSTTLHEGAGIVDRCERGKLALTGADAKSFLQGQVTNDTERLVAGSGCYAAFLTPKGKMLGDVRILDTGAELLLDTERVALQPLFNLILRYSIGYDVTLHKRTLETGLLSVIGPRAAVALGANELPATEHAHAALSVDGLSVRAIRTPEGIDVLCDATDTEALRDALIRAGAAAVGEQAAECVRIESGRPRYGVELDDTVIPQEAGLNARAVSFTKGCYVGQETVARLFYRGKPNRHLQGLRCEAPVAPGDAVRLCERVVATIASATVSPGLGPIALALVRREAPVGSPVRVGEGDVAAMVVELPFA
jgi:tRNA-modifying protein YgfZ